MAGHNDRYNPFQVPRTPPPETKWDTVDDAIQRADKVAAWLVNHPGRLTVRQKQILRRVLTTGMMGLNMGDAETDVWMKGEA